MSTRKLSQDEVQKFMQGCEDLMSLGGRFTENIRRAVTDLKNTYEPTLKSQYVDKAVVELLTQSLQEFERKVQTNLEAIDKICLKGGKWFAFYLGRSVGEQSASENLRASEVAPRSSESETSGNLSHQTAGQGS